MCRYCNSEIKKTIYDYVEDLYPDKEGFFTESAVEDFIGEIGFDKDFDYETGATKCVILPANENFVIKIPFNGTPCQCSNCEYYKWDEKGNYYDCTHSDEGEDCPVIPLDGAGGEHPDNYCEREINLYNIIKNEYPEFIDFFVPNTWIFDIHNLPVYIQKRVTPYSYDCKEDLHITEKSITSIETHKKKISAPLYWLARCLENLNNDLEKYDRFITMLKDLGINKDLHNGNVGFYNGHAIIMDYAGYNY